ncbi:hypothetical protein VKT23_011972 [Stygiomarasmius scandens]|uniref:C2H2-type domain-containing protein n=1 Tax=Marasmiellus scandens TaxID=2682957 RepID=A0ABR1J7G3_9AGAR
MKYFSMDYPCPTCWKIFSSSKDRNIHLSRSNDELHHSYRNKRFQLDANLASTPSSISQPNPDDPTIIIDEGADEDHVELELNEIMSQFQISHEEDLFQYVPYPAEESGQEDQTNSNQATTQTHKAKIWDEEDERTLDTNHKAGKGFKMHKELYDKWTELQKEKDSGTESSVNYYPFASELDWKIAHWAVTEKISHHAITNLLSIPEVN